MKKLLSFCLTLVLLNVPSLALARDHHKGNKNSDESEAVSKSEEKQEKNEEKEEKKRKRDGDPCAEGDQSPAPCMSWINPLIKPRVALLCIHGLGLNSRSYTTFGKRMSHMGIATYAIDVRGFGSWMKAQGHEEVDFDGCLCDVKRTLQAIHQAQPGLPVLLLGESMGGAIAMRACSMYPELIDGLISSVPAGERFQQKKTDFKVAMQFLTGPNRQHDIGSSIIDQATQNPKLKEEWESDPLNRMNLSAKELWQFQRFMNDNHDAAKKIDKTPVLILQGMLDRLVKPEGTWDLFNELETEQKTFIALPSEHLIFEEGEAKSARFDQRVARLAAGWISNFVPAVEDRGTVADLLGAGAQNGLPNGGPGALRSAIAERIGAGGAGVNPIGSAAGSSVGANPSGLGIGNDIGAAVNLGANSEGALLTQGVPTAVTFVASWAEQCKGVEQVIQTAGRMFGNRVKLIKVDVGDRANDNLVKAYNIGPIPTTLFLRPDGSVASTLIGRTALPNYVKGIHGLIGMPPNLPPMRRMRNRGARGGLQQ